MARNKYSCAGCGQIVPNKEIEVDHVSPVVEPTQGFVDWNTYVARLFCDASNLQCLCRACHIEKGRAEGKIRLARKKAEKPPKEPKEAKPKKAAKKKQARRRPRKQGD